MTQVAGDVAGSRLSVQTGYPVIQYKETDWEFCKRMASRVGLAVYGDPLSHTPRLEIGLVEKGRTASFRTEHYKVCIDETYYHLKSIGSGKNEFLYYQVESEENYEIGESSFYHGQRRYIFEKTAELVNGTLVFRYKIGGKCRFGQKKYENKKIAGASLRGKVEKREGQSVYLKLDIDGTDAKAVHPYPWAPVTGNIMYCMPQPETEACLYFPDAGEENAYAVNEIHKNACPDFADVQNRGLVSENAKKVQMYPDKLCFLGGKEGKEQKCQMGEDALIFGIGTGKLQIIGKEQIVFRAPEIALDASKKIGQYKMERRAVQKESELYPRGSRNPATGGGDLAAEHQNEFNVSTPQGILLGTEYEYYKPFQDAPVYEEYQEIPTWVKVLAGVAVAAVVGLAVGALVFCTGGLGLVAAGGVAAGVLGTAAGAVTAGAGIAAVAAMANNDKEYGMESSLGDYLLNALSASTRVGGSILALGSFLAMPIGLKRILMVASGAYLVKEWAMLIPQHVSNTTVLEVFDALTWLPVDKDTIENNAKPNLESLKKMEVFNKNSYIEDQANWTNIKFGEADMAYSGCEIIATYNAVKALGGASSPHYMTSLISYYEKNGAALKGGCGVAPYATVDYFSKQGYKVEASESTNPEIINTIGERNSTIIVTVYNDDRDIRKMIHTVSITKEAGKYVVHNGYNLNESENTYGPSEEYDSVQEAINGMNKNEGKKASLLYIVGISEP